jgi:1-phosphatidylinositol-3-phosphate 5-kinase
MAVVSYFHSFIINPTNNLYLDLGGTFTFNNVTSQAQHTILTTLLHVSIYIHLSLILEQHLLHDSGVSLLFPPNPLPPSFSAPVPHHFTRTTTLNVHKPISKKLQSLVPSSILSFFSRTSTGIARSTTIMPVFGADLGIPTSPSRLELLHEAQASSPRSSTDTGGGRLRRLSFIGARRPSSRGGVKETDLNVHGNPSPLTSSTSTSSSTTSPPLSISFTTALTTIQHSSSLLSTSPGIVFPAPSLIVDLAEKERKDPQRRLKGDERAGLGSLLGWDKEGKEKGKAMAGLQGFLRHQAFSVLVSYHVLSAESTEKDREGDKDKDKEPPGSSSYVHPVKPYLFTICGRPRWRTMGYYSFSRACCHSGGDAAKEKEKEKDEDREKEKDREKGKETDREKDRDKDAPKAPEKDKPTADKPNASASASDPDPFHPDDYNGDGDRTLGDAIREWVEGAGRGCVRRGKGLGGCTVRRGEHEVRYVHGGVRVGVSVREAEAEGGIGEGEGEGDGEGDGESGILMWESCAVCHARTKKRVMSDGT